MRRERLVHTGTVCLAILLIVWWLLCAVGLALGVHWLWVHR